MEYEKHLVDASGIRLLALDFDGVLTDNKVLVGEDGAESVVCNRLDGYGIERVVEAGFEVIVVSRERNPVVKARCDKLGIECVHGVLDKLPLLEKALDDKGLSLQETCFMGNDVPDLECMRACRLGVAVRDAVPAVLEEADYVTERAGGDGAVRELCNILIQSRRK